MEAAHTHRVDIIVVDEVSSMDEVRVMEQLLQQGLSIVAGVNCVTLEHFTTYHKLRCLLGLTSKEQQLVANGLPPIDTRTDWWRQRPSGGSSSF